MDQAIITLIKMLDLKGRHDLSALLVQSKTEILESTQYGSRLYSTLSTMLIYSPPEYYLKIKELPQSDRDIIFKLIQEIYPPTDNEPEIVQSEFRILTEDVVKPDVEKTDGGFIEKSVRLFISYAKETEGNTAGNIKSVLEQYFGIDVFLAHEDIQGAREWEKEIIENLNRTDIFIALLSQGFIKSEYTDQEVGAACAKHKLIVPISINGVMPYGFIRKLQAIKLRLDPVKATISEWLVFCEEIVAAISRDERYVHCIRSSLIRAFSQSWSFKESQRFIPIIEKFEPYSTKQVNNIIEAISKNGQINHEAFAVPQFTKGLVDRHKIDVDPKYLVELYKTPIYSDKT